MQKLGKRENVPATSTGISKVDPERAGLIATGRSEEATQVRTLSRVFSSVSAPNDCSGATFLGRRVRIFIAGIVIFTLFFHFVIATWGRGDTTSRLPACAGLPIGPIVVQNLKTEVSAHILSCGRQILHTNGLLATYAA